ncbi:cytochrome P450 [Aquimarina sp. U1-2]|uniref:cytochrome P450 n=1 Tax=Aquimarina sp. U1-2 TaxID=2823141 RepID=UPI001AECD740|nr:cytochrome P450 [Aquimarina sp. U1-2]MBP2832518.1 cytochrome P450 [Aquimarina sp. U1-2]
MSTTIPTVSFFEVLKNANRILKNPLPFHHKNFRRHGDLFRVELGFGNSVVFTRDAGLAKHTLQKNHRNYQKSSLQTEDLAKYIGEGLLTAEGDKWLKQRRLIQPAFHKKKLEDLVQTIKNVIVEESCKVQLGQPFDVYPLMSDLAFKVVAKSLFSYTDTHNTIARLQHITQAAQQFLIKEIRQPYKRWWFHLNGKIRRTHRLTQEARDLLNTIIDDRKNSNKRHHDLLDMLLEARYEDGSAMDNEQLIDEILILFTAGHETTSNALTFTLLLLANHLELQEKVYQEVANPKVVNATPLEEVAAYTYTKQCIEESMRLYPPVYFSDRVAIQNDKYNDFTLKKGTTILISFFEIHRHLDLWENPLQFNPDRFHPEKDKKAYADIYFPFGAGPRMCIGNNFAMYEMILAISELVRNYKITAVSKEIEIKPLITLKPAASRLVFEKR